MLSAPIPLPSRNIDLEHEADVTTETAVSLKKRRHKKEFGFVTPQEVSGWLVWYALREGFCGVDRFTCCQAVCLVNNDIRYSSHINKASSQNSRNIGNMAV
jgi:hypothetical protein